MPLLQKTILSLNINTPRINTGEGKGDFSDLNS